MRFPVLPLLLLALATAGCSGRPSRTEVEQIKTELSDLRSESRRSMDTVRDVVRQMHETALRDQAARQSETAHAHQRTLMAVVLAILGGALAVTLYGRIRGRTNHAS